MFVKIIKSYRDVVGVCDSEILGSVFEEGNIRLEVKENCLKGDKMPKDKVIGLMKKMSSEDATFNIVGKKSVDCALDAGVITKENIKRVNGIPFALVLA